jgi:murein DD-endopeptidase MepM/ murein hydrolase activator NlpD
MCDVRCLTSMLIVAALGTGLALAQLPNASRDDRILPGRLGLPATNTRSSEPFVTRIYKTGDNDQILKKQPRGYPFTITEDYELGENEKAQVHKGVDITSRPAPNEPARPMDFKAGVYGVVVRAGSGDWGTIAVQLRDGSVLQYLHTTASLVKVGDVVAPETLLGVTGRTGRGTFISISRRGTSSVNSSRPTWHSKWDSESHRRRSSLNQTQEPTSILTNRSESSPR